MAGIRAAALFDRSIEARPNRAWAELVQLAAHTPHLRLDMERHHAVFSGSDEGELDRTVKAIARQLSVGFQISEATAAVRLRLSASALVETTHSVVEAWQSEFAQLKLLFWSGAPGSGFTFNASASPDAVPTRFTPVISRVLRRASEGLFADLNVSLMDGACRQGDSRARPFERAALAALRDPQVQRLAELVEPVGRVRVQVPKAAAESVAAELGRRGVVQRAKTSGALRDFIAEAPASRLLGLSRRLAQIIGEPAPCTMVLTDYRPLFSGKPAVAADAPRQEIEKGELVATALGVAFPIGVATAFEPTAQP